jgi:hypothetical protein
MDWAELSRPALPAAPAQTPDASRPHKESWEAWGEDAAGPTLGTAAGSFSGTSTSTPSIKLDLRLPLAFSLLCFASVSMTLGNKWLMTRPALRPHTELVIILCS